MRIGTNPEKDKCSLLTHKQHRIIMPFWIPNVTDDYFKKQPEVLRFCLQSLIDSIDLSKTNITLINNNSCSEASKVAEEFVEKGLIDKYVVRSENRGKLEIVLAEARAAYEDYITISDADFLFFKGWENTVAKIYTDFKRAGVVTIYPCPNLAFNHNSRWIFKSGWKCGSVLKEEDMNLVDKGLGHSPGKGIYKSLGVKKKYVWAEKQYYLEKGENRVCLGAVHALATMKRDIFKQLPFSKIEYVFKNGYEETHLDYFSDKLGYYRLSTTQCFAYHMGNTLPDEDVMNHAVIVDDNLVSFPAYKNRNKQTNIFLSNISKFFVRFGRKFRLV